MCKKGCIYGWTSDVYSVFWNKVSCQDRRLPVLLEWQLANLRNVPVSVVSALRLELQTWVFVSVLGLELRPPCLHGETIYSESYLPTLSHVFLTRNQLTVLYVTAWRPSLVP